MLHLIDSHFDMQKTARSGLHILLGGVCALTVVVFFRFVSSSVFGITLLVLHLLCSSAFGLIYLHLCG